MRLRPSVFLALAGLLLSLPLRAADVPIHDLQGAGTESPVRGQSIATTGVVTARRTNGFYLQVPDAESDADPSTSEGIYVFTSSAPPSAAAVGNRVRVTGTVVEYRPSADLSSPPLTELGGSPQVTFLASGNALPLPVLLTADDLSPSAPADRLEKYEGMRVRVASLVVVAPTAGSVSELSATATSNGVFYGVFSGAPRPFREAGAEVGIALPAGSPCCVPRFDGNPERLRVDSDALAGAAPLDVAAGVTLSDLVGPLDYAYRSYTLLPETSPAPSDFPAARAVPAPAAGELTVGSANLQRFFDATESGDGTTLSADALAAGEADPAYHAFLEEGNDPGGIDVGFLVAACVEVLSVVQEGKSATYVSPVSGNAETLNDRPPLVLRARRAAPDGTDVVFTVIANHLRSLSGAGEDPTDGRRVRAKRQAQAEYLASLLARLQSEGGGTPLVAVGDFNAYEVSDGLVDVMGTVRGAPAPADQVVVNRSVDLVDPELVDLCVLDGLLPPTERYSYVFDGNAQLLDHVLASAATLPRVTGLAMARFGSDFPEAMRGDPTRSERLTDHDAPVVRLRLGASETRSATIPLRDGELPAPGRRLRP